ncbi:MAG: tetratricopeptide repeat protein, partial [Chrysiogenales bacterium]
ITFTNILYVIISGIVMAVNLVVPAIFIANGQVKGYKKLLYYAVSLIFLPVFMLILLYFRVPMNSDVFVTKVGNFDALMNVNFNAEYIRNRATVTMSGIPVFDLSDSVVRNHKRSLVPIALYHPVERNILFIDGNQRFFRNPVIGYFDNSVCIDLMSDRDVDYRRLPYSGTQTYVPENDSLLFYLEKHRSRYHTIVDIPNIMDQRINPFRFSAEYYRVMKNRLDDGGIFVQVFNIPGCRQEIFASAMKGLRRSFLSHTIYYFSNLLVVLSSDDEKAFSIDSNAYDRLVRFFNTREALSGLFYNEAHILSHLLFRGIDDLPAPLIRGSYRPGLFFMKSKSILLERESMERYSAGNRVAIEYLVQSPEMLAFNRVFMDIIRINDPILSLLKKAEIAEAQEDYNEETALLFELKRQAEYRIDLQRYVFNMIGYKEKYFYSAAMRLEKERKWEDSRGLYRAVLAINPDHFDANYRMGLLCLTLQDIDGSFYYLQQAMRIQKDDPKALYQMGVLHYSTGRFTKAIENFAQSLQKNDKTPGVYRYLGLCYENAGNLYEAERSYARAIIEDPNDVDTKSRLEEVRSIIEKEKKKWDTPEKKNEFEAEQNADMPLPVSRGAYEMRLKDDDTSLPVADPSGESGDPSPNP